MAADNEVGTGLDQQRATTRWSRTVRVVYWVPQCGSTRTTSTSSRSVRTTSVTCCKSETLSGPVRGRIRTRRAPARVAVAAGVSPIASNATIPNRTPFRTTTTGRAAAARSVPAPTPAKPPASTRRRVCRSAFGP